MMASRTLPKRVSQCLLALLIGLLVASSAQPASAQIFRRRSSGGFNPNRQTPAPSRSTPIQARPAPFEARPAPFETRPPALSNGTVPTPRGGAGGGTPSDPAVLKRDIENLQRTIRDQQARISNLDSQLKGKQTSSDNYVQQIQKLQQQVNSASAAAASAQRKVDQMKLMLDEASGRADETIQSLRTEVTRAKSEASTAQERLDRALAEKKTAANVELQPSIKSLQEQVRQAQLQLDTARQSVQEAEQARTIALEEGQRTAQELRQELSDSRALYLTQLQIQREVLQAAIDKQVRATTEQVLRRANVEIEKRVAAAKASANDQLREERARSAALARDLDAKAKAQLATGSTSSTREALAQLVKAEDAAKNAQLVVRDTLGSQGIEKLELIRRKLSGLGDAKIAAYSFSTSGQISMNLNFQTIYGKLDVGGQLYDTARIQEAIQPGSESTGDDSTEDGSWIKTLPRLSAPDVVLARHPMLSRRDTSDFANVRVHAFKEHGRAHAGFSSERIVSWAGPESGAGLGLTVDAERDDASADEMVDMLMLEILDTLSWLETHVDRGKLAKATGSSSDEDLNYCFFKHFVQPLLATFLNNSLQFENEFLVVRLVPVNFERDVKLRGAADWTGNVSTAHHKAVSFVLKDLVRREDPLHVSVRDFKERTCSSLETKLVNWSVPITRWLADNPEKAVPELKPLADFLRHGPKSGGSSAHSVGGIALNWIAASKELYKRTSEALDINQEFLEGIWKPGQPNFDNHDPVIDLRGNEREKRLAALLQSFVFGNEGRVVIHRLEFNLSDYTINAQFQLEHQHVWTSPDELLGFLHKSMQTQFESIVGQVESQLEQAGPRVAK